MRLFLRGAAERWVAEGQSGGGGTPMASPSDDGRGEATVSCDAAGCSGAVHGMRVPPWRRVAVGASQGAQEQCVACVHHPGGVWQWAPRGPQLDECRWCALHSRHEHMRRAAASPPRAASPPPPPFPDPAPPRAHAQPHQWRRARMRLRPQTLGTMVAPAAAAMAAARARVRL